MEQKSAQYTIKRRTQRNYDLDEVFAWILKFKQTHDGNSPNYAEIMAEFGISSKAVTADILKRLEKAGRIKRNGTRRAARMIEVIGGRWTFQPNGAER